MRISEVARRAGVNVQTLRFYERRGLMVEPPRRASGQREYAESSVQQVRFIKRTQRLGFTLDEVQELLRLSRRDSRSCEQVRVAAEAKLVDVEERLKRLGTMRAALGALVASCRRGGSQVCPMLWAADEEEATG